jgi:hypothetical protein
VMSDRIKPGRYDVVRINVLHPNDPRLCEYNISIRRDVSGSELDTTSHAADTISQAIDFYIHHKYRTVWHFHIKRG